MVFITRYTFCGCHKVRQDEQEAQLSQRDRAAACLNFDKNISANSVHLTLLYVRALTSTNHHFTVLRHHVCTQCNISQHLGINFGGIWRFQLGFYIWVFMLKKSGLFLKVLWQQCRVRTCAIVLHAFCIAIFIRLNRLSRNTSKPLS